MAEEPLLELEESWVFGMLWPKRLLIFEDRIEMRGTELLHETAETIRYGEITDAVIGGSGWSASLLLKRSGKPVLLRGVEESAAARAKALIEEGTSRAARASVETSPDSGEGSPNKADLIRKLTELRAAGVLSSEEYETKKRTVEKGNP